MKRIGSFGVFTIALGSVIGWGAFILPGTFFLQNAGVLNTLIGFFFGVIMIIIIERNYALLMTKHKGIGGEYNFATNEFGNITGFVTGWLLLLAYISIIPLNATAVPMVLDKIIPTYSSGALLYTVAGSPVFCNDLVVSIATVLIFSIIQLKGLHCSTIFQNIMVLILILCVLSLFFVTIIAATPSQYQNLSSNQQTLNVKSIISIIAFIPWAFVGFDTVAQVKNESRISVKNLSVSTMLAIIFGGLIYNMLNVVTAFGVHHMALEEQTWPTGEAIASILGPTALIIIGLAMFGAVLSGLNGFFISATRLVSAIVMKKNTISTELNLIIWGVCLLSTLVPFFGRNALIWFVNVSSVGASFTYLVVTLAAFKISNTTLTKIYSILGIICSTLFLVFLLTPFFGSSIPPISMVVLIGWLFLGGFVYFIFPHFKQNG